MMAATALLFLGAAAAHGVAWRLERSGRPILPTGHFVLMLGCAALAAILIAAALA